MSALRPTANAGATQKQGTAEGFNGEVTPPAISRQELGMQQTRLVTF